MSTTTETIRDTLTALAAEVGSGGELGTTSDLHERLGVERSRTQLRYALRDLENEGVLRRTWGWVGENRKRAAIVWVVR